MEWSCQKFTSSNNNIVLYCDGSNKTHIYDESFNLQSQHDVKGLNLLYAGCGRLVYRGKIGDETMVEVYTENHLFVSRLRLPEGRKWREELSVCAVPGTEMIMVADKNNCSLDVFTAQAGEGRTLGI